MSQSGEVTAKYIKRTKESVEHGQPESGFKSHSKKTNDTTQYNILKKGFRGLSRIASEVIKAIISSSGKQQIKTPEHDAFKGKAYLSGATPKTHPNSNQNDRTQAELANRLTNTPSPSPRLEAK